MPKVYNKAKDRNIPEDAVYVGRPSKWGNPFRIGEFFAGKTLTREDCIMLHSHLLHNSNAGTKLLNDIGELKGKDLVCWCAPLPCHADTLLKLANKEESNV